MGQTCGVADPSQWMRVFGIDIDSRDTTELIETARAVREAEVEQVRRQSQVYFALSIPQDEMAERSLRLYIALKRIIAREQWDFYTIQSFPGLADDYTATCLAQSLMLNDGFGTSTLGDFNTAMTVKLLTDLSPEPVYYGDLQHIDKKGREIKIIGDGACPPALAGAAGAAKFGEHSISSAGEAGGVSVDLTCKAGVGVLARLGRTNGEFELVLARCTISEPPTEHLEERRRECGIPFWPHAFVEAHCDMDQLVEAWNNQHACLGYGAHLYDALAAFGAQTGLKVVAL